MKKHKTLLIIAGIVLFILCAFVIPEHNRKVKAYNTAMQYLEMGDTTNAHKYFLMADDYKDAREQADKLYDDSLRAVIREIDQLIYSSYSHPAVTGSKASSDKTTSDSSGTKTTGSSSKHGKSYGKTKSSDAYDDGYDSVYMDEDYDWDRYQKDDDYARGVDDAMEDMDEDW